MNQSKIQTDYTTVIGTNLELFGSDLEHKIKELAAQAEAEWTQLDLTKPDLHIWRIEKFHVVKRPEALTGSFHEGDSYIVLKISKENNKTSFSIHFWLGSSTTTDEMCVAAYKTVELDTFLKGAAIQYRETQFNETNLFRSYFPHLTYLTGGIDSGFRIIRDTYFDDFVPNLIRIHDKKYLHVLPDVSNLTDDDVYILDIGPEFYVYVGPNSTHQERYLAEILLQSVKTIRKAKLKFCQKDSDITTIKNRIEMLTKN